MVQCTKEFEILAESLPQLVWMKNPDGSRVYLSKRWSDYTGISIEDKIWDWTQAIHPDDLEKTIFYWDECVISRNIFQHECRIKKNDGTYRWYLTRAVPVTDTSGDIVWIGTCTDMHDYRMREEFLIEKNNQLQKINSDITNFIYTTSLDLKAPLFNIEGLILALRDDLKMKIEENEKILFEMVDISVKKIKGVIYSLTEISKSPKNINGNERSKNNFERIKD